MQERKIINTENSQMWFLTVLGMGKTMAHAPHLASHLFCQNNFLSEHNHAQLSTYCLWLLSHYNDKVGSCDIDLKDHRLKKFYYVLP